MNTIPHRQFFKLAAATVATAPKAVFISADGGEWLACDGSAQPIAEFPELFALIGRIFGGHEQTFNLPKEGDAGLPPSIRPIRYLIKARAGGDDHPIGQIRSCVATQIA